MLLLQLRERSKSLAIQFLESGGQYRFNALSGGPNVFANAPSIVNNAPLYNGSSYALFGFNVTGNTLVLPNAPFTTAYIGARVYVSNLTQNFTLGFLDASFLLQCQVVMNTVTGTLSIKNRAGTVLGTSSNAFVPAQWQYVEFKAIFSTTGTGTCEVKVNGVVWLTVTSVTNATTTANASVGQWTSTSGSTNSYFSDLYVVDTTGAINTTYLGDITVAELYPNGAGTNSAWTSNPAASFSLTSVANASAGTTVYTGTITGGASNAYQGYYFTVTGFTTGANNGTFLCSASTATTITLVNASGVAETHAATCAFQAIPQAGIHGGIVDGYATTSVGTRPNGDVAYLSSSTPTQKHDFTHQPLTLTGQIAGTIHRYYARKDDAGTRQVAGYCLSGGTEGDGTTQSLSALYQYYSDIYETDPNTSAAWTLVNFNNAKFGLQEIS